MTVQDKFIVGNTVGILVSTEEFLGFSTEIDRKNKRYVELRESLLFDPELINLCLLELHDKFKTTATEKLFKIQRDYHILTYEVPYKAPNCRVAFLNKGERFAIVSRDDVDYVYVNTWEFLVRESTGIPAHFMNGVCNSTEIIEKEHSFSYFVDKLRIPVHVA